MLYSYILWQLYHHHIFKLSVDYNAHRKERGNGSSRANGYPKPFPFVVAWLPVRRGLSVHESLHLMGNAADTRRNSGTGTSPVRKYHEPNFLQTGAGSSSESVEKSIQRYMEVS